MICCSCRNVEKRYRPIRSPELSEGLYLKYSGNLERAYEKDDNFEIAIQLANLKEPSDRVFKYLLLSLNDINNCDQIFDWYYLYEQHDFAVNILKLDTALYMGSIEYCEQMFKDLTYREYSYQRSESERIANDNKSVEDSSKFDMKLIEELRIIYDSDQELRKKRSKINISNELKIELGVEIQRLDSINLRKIHDIFEKYGYPSRNLVGKIGNLTPALVIHHSNSLEDRYRYIPLLEKAVESGILYEGTLNMIKRRIEDMELDEKYN